MCSGNLRKEDVDLDFIESYEKAKGHIYPKIINREHNSGLLDEVPHVDFGDLSVIFRIEVDTLGDGSVGNVTVRNEFAGRWGVDTSELLKTARENMNRNNRPSIKSMFSVLRNLSLNVYGDGSDVNEDALCALQGDNAPEMYVLGVERKPLGAVGIIDDELLSEFAGRIGSDLYILPSSIHELILLPNNDNGESIDQLMGMVHEVNSTQVCPEDFLSYNVYLFSRDEKCISIAATGEKVELKIA